ncbi:enoyl-CoA hydratase [Cytobacillus depressus]|uniref:Enoyl-CoA hydratase n=1 Tax=Cytobacillus depressus TaxID=1602942 RepID=A0A6L3UZG2_9BACI|nr:enoyl-CoA hydratase-related protein [Cytobacillus depressus]KAB2328356.1 enoyl-CoA hydratase [Cytobacillus depressus]
MKELMVETQNGVRTLTLNRPERLNAITPSLHLQLEQALSEAAVDDDVRVVVITGAGRGFCAGLDLLERKNQETSSISRSERLDELRWVGRQALGIVHCDKPVIAAINGIAAGAGFALSLACDIRFMSKSARVTTGYIRRALSPDGGMSYFLPKLVGQAKASELIFTGRDINSDEAERIGLVNGVFPSDEFYEQVMIFARNLAEGPPIALTLSKRLLTESTYPDLRTILKQEITAIQSCFNTKDGIEGIHAFAEKRKPVFIGE